MARTAVVVDISSLVRWNKLLVTEAATIAGRVRPAVGSQAEIVERRAVAEAPELTGALKGSIHSFSTGGGLRQGVRAGRGLRRPYAPFQEFGTKRHAANPFLITQADSQTHDELARKVDAAVLAGAIMRGGA